MQGKRKLEFYKLRNKFIKKYVTMQGKRKLEVTIFEIC